MNARAAEVLTTPGGRRGLRRILPFIGPAVIASIAYMDPGNFATNIQGGASFGYSLLWVILAANIMAMLIQNLSAKVGIATGRNLPELIRERFPKPVVWFYWVQAELVAMATDLAEFLGAAIAISLLTQLPLFWGAVITAVITFWLLTLQRRGYRPLELAIGAFVLTIGVAYLVQFVIARPALADLGRGFLPTFEGKDAVYLAVGIIGATVMPHVIYLHSALTQGRVPAADDTSKRRLSRLNRVDVIASMGFAGLINMSMLAVAAATFHGKNVQDAGNLETAYQTLTPLLGPAAAIAFAIALLASGISSSAVGTMAGQVIMQGFVGFSIPLWVRRVLTMLPAFVVILLGLNPTDTLVLSQVVLSFGVPFALVPLLMFTARRDVMGVLVSRPWVTALGWVFASVIIGLNVYLLWGALGGG
ncbi:manganese transport protein [Deinococcus metalli]|uniref:Divalent metal cation transporter MntH n=1 Tax=Deinococcus metalli TaxID=1141878 RepID=A0A7W8KE79_9DEIO|nr:Nramp family divalent metal transporter [Deinococcus metalli]MBB5375458.1 manganese transport protein [Deinococcus metalli]GHF29132.1 divalent metal cation transporter MntH [Deinococcus metalli]